MSEWINWPGSVIDSSAIGPMLKGLFTVDFDLEQSSQVKVLIVLFSILKPFDRNHDCSQILAV